MKIKIRLRSGLRLATRAIPTAHPLLFVTPVRVKKEFSPTGRAHWSQDDWAITHKPTGYAIAHAGDPRAAIRLAQLFAISDIPWKKLRAKKDARRYAKQYAAILEKFDSAELSIGFR